MLRDQAKIRWAIWSLTLLIVPVSYNACLVSEVTSGIVGASDGNSGRVSLPSIVSQQEVLNTSGDPFAPQGGASKIIDGNFAFGVERDEEASGEEVIVDSENHPERMAMYNDANLKSLQEGVIQTLNYSFLSAEIDLPYAEICESGSSGGEKRQSMNIHMENGEIIVGHLTRHEGNCIQEGQSFELGCFALMGISLEVGESPPSLESIDPSSADFQLFFETQPGGCNHLEPQLFVGQSGEL